MEPVKRVWKSWEEAPWRGLTWIGLASAGLYLILARHYPLEASLSVPRGGWVSLVGSHPDWIAFQLGIYLALSVLAAAALRLLIQVDNAHGPGEAGQAGRQVWVIMLTWLVCCIILASMAPAGESHDIFDYLFRGRMMAEYHASPLAEIPKTYNQANFYFYIAWHSYVDTYGPLWEMASAGTAMLVRQAAQALGWWQFNQANCPDSPGSCRLLILYLLGYRLLAIGLCGAAAGLIAGLVRREQPRRVPAALVAWLWNPLTLFAAAVGAHNDFLMIVLLLAGLWLMQRGLSFWALIALFLAAHVKLTALIWAPAFGLWVIRQRGLRTALTSTVGALSAGALLSWLLYYPFGGWETLTRMLYERSLYYANSPWAVANNLLIVQTGWLNWAAKHLTNSLPNWLALAGALLIPLGAFGFLPGRWKAAARDIDERRLWAAVTAATLFYLLVGAFWFQHWYLLWILAPAALTPARRFAGAMLPWLCFGALAANFSDGFLLSLPLEGSSRNWLQLLILAIIWLPGLIAAGWVRYAPNLSARPALRLRKPGD